MIKKILLIILPFSCLINISAYSQQNFEGGLFENFGVAIKAGLLYGGGIDFSTSLHSHLKLRAGFSYLGLDATDYFDTNGDETINKAKMNFSNGNLLIDYFLVKKGIFHLTTGLYFGQNKIDIVGSGFDNFAINDYVIEPVDGKFSGTLKFGSAVKPYFGIGLGRTITQSRVGFKFELGAVYQGKFKVESPYLNPELSSLDVDDSIDIDLLESSIWPMMTFSISYRIQ